MNRSAISAPLDLLKNQTDSPMLEIESLSADVYPLIGEVRSALHELTLSVFPGQILVVAGEEDSGAALLTQLCAGFLPPDTIIRSGSIRIDGEALRLGRRGFRSNRLRKQIALIPSRATAPVDPMRTVREWSQNLRRVAHTSKHAWSHFLADTHLTEEQLASRELLIHQSPLMLKKMGILRGLAHGAHLLISEVADDDLDPISEDEYRECLAHVARKFDLAVLASVRSLRKLSPFATRIAMLFEGRVLEEGPSEEVLSQPQYAYTAAFSNCHPQLGKPLSAPPLIPSQAIWQAEETVGLIPKLSSDDKDIAT